MERSKNAIGGLLAGAGLMYLLDPDRGRRRRATMRDRLAHVRNKVDDATDTTGRDLRNRARGMAAEARSRLRPDAADDTVLVERVRSRIGRAVSHPHAIEVDATDGDVILSGPVLRDEIEPLLSAVRSVRGVRDVSDRLEPHDEPGRVSGLQGTPSRRRRMRPEFLQDNWAPAARFVAGLAGGTALLYAGRFRGPLRWALGGTGAGLLARAATNMQMKRLTGVSAGRRGIDVQKSVNVDAPVHEIFDFWNRFENFPRFMSHLREVRRTGDRTSHWVAAGPVGSTPEWDAEITDWIPNEMIRWRSVEGSTIENAGWVRFQPNEQGGTRVDIHMSYNPPGGAVGHMFASLFGSDPKHALDEDMVRFKSLIEQGRTSAPGRKKVELDQLEGGRRPTGAPRPRA